MVFTRAEAVADGVRSDSELKSLLKRGDHVRLVRGVYADAAELAGWEEDQHRTRVLGVARISNLLVSHISAAVLHGLPVPGGDLTEVHATRLGVGGNRHRSTRHVHSGIVSPEWQTTLEGVYVTTVARTLVDVAKTQPRLAAVTAADAALHRDLCTYEEITDALHSAYRHRGAPRARAALRLADGRAESPGETWTRLALTHPSLPPCELQIEVYDEHGRFVGRADGGYLEHGVLWEYDGQDKYHRLLAPGQTTLDAVLAEKRRESGFTELGWLVVRVDSSDFRVPETLRRRMLDAIARSSRPGWLPPTGSWAVTPRHLSMQRTSLTA